VKATRLPSATKVIAVAEMEAVGNLSTVFMMFSPET
jgi:hypothetical protein